MIANDAVATHRPRPSGPPLRGRAALRDGIRNGRLVGRQNTGQGAAGSTLNWSIRGLRSGVGVMEHDNPDYAMDLFEAVFTSSRPFWFFVDLYGRYDH